MILLGCGAANIDVRIEEDRSAQISGHGVGLGPVFEKQRFQSGKRVTIRFATLFVDERSAIRKRDVEVGDELAIDKDRWQVVEIIPGGASSRAVVVLRKVSP